MGNKVFVTLGVLFQFGLENFLKRLGLTEYEAKAYLALLKLGSADAKTLAEASGVPRTRIYDVIHRLERHSLVQRKSRERPAPYTPTPPEVSLEMRIRQVLGELDSGFKTVQKIYYSSRSEETFDAWVIRGESQTYPAAVKLAREVSNLLIFRCASLPPKVFQQMVEALKSAKRRGARTITALDRSLRESIGLQNFEAFLREFNPRIEVFFLPLNMVFSDFKDLLVFYAPTSGQIETPEPVGLYVKTGKLEGLLRERFERAFGLLPPRGRAGLSGFI
ncbi:MAG: TrmB family transcriptional regulator [Candidatus Hecatellaceae archaeon]